MNVPAIVLISLAAIAELQDPAAGDDCVEPRASPVVAECDDRRVTLSEVDAAISGSLEVLREALGRSRRERMLEVAATQVLEVESLRRKTSPQMIVQREAGDALALPTVEDARAFYERHRESLPGGFGAHRATILEQMTLERRRRARLELAARLHVELETRWTCEGLALGDTSLAPSTPLARIGTRVVTLGDVDRELHPLPVLVEDEIYELRRVEIERRLEEWSRSAPQGSDRARPTVFLKPPRSGDERLVGADEPSVGPADAPVTVVAFVDFQCANCAQVHAALTSLVAARPDALRVVLRDFPLSDHEHSVAAALAAEAARAQGRYWDYSALLFERQPSLAPEHLRRYAGELGLDLERFEAALSAPEPRARVGRDRSDGIALGVFSTPTVFVNGRRVLERDREGLGRAVDQATRER